MNEERAAPKVPPLSDDLRRELERRLAQHRANPESAIPWEKARGMLRERFWA